MKKIFLFLLLSAAQLQAQSDSLTFAQKTWEEVKIAKGVKWKQAHFRELFASEQEINMIEIKGKRNLKRVLLGGHAKTLKTTEDFAREYGARVAMNGGFFDMKNGGAVDFIKVNGQVINHTKSTSERANALFIGTGKKIRIQSWSEDLPEGKNVMLSGPLLLANTHRVKLGTSAFNDNRHPRTAIAVKKGKKVLFLVVDGRNKQAEGMSLLELSKVLQWLGATDAMNLDGGGSSTLYIDGKGVVNYPSDNKKFDHEGQRPVANIIYLKK